MFDDPRIKRVLRRYPKDDQFSDASIDLSTYGASALLEACRRKHVDDMAGPIELDDHALAHFTQRMGIEFDRSMFDYFLHSYVRSGFFEAYYDDPTVTSFPVCEDGPPARIPCPKGAEWCAVRPKDGKEHFELFQIQKPMTRSPDCADMHTVDYQEDCQSCDLISLPQPKADWFANHGVASSRLDGQLGAGNSISFSGFSLHS